MAYNTEGLRADVMFKLQGNVRYLPSATQDIVLDGLNRGIERVVAFASEDYDVQNVFNPPDPTGAFTYAMEWPLPANLIYVASVSCDGTTIRAATQEQFVSTRAERSRELAEIPSIYYIRAGLFLNVWPRPSAQKTYQIYGLFKPPDLVNPTDPIPLDRLYSDALVSYACWWCLQGQTGEIERAASFLQDYMFQRAEAKFNKSQNTQHAIRNVKPQR